MRTDECGDTEPVFIMIPHPRTGKIQVLFCVRVILGYLIYGFLDNNQS